MNIFIIPGNPPTMHFYGLWGQDIMKALPGARVRVSPYPLLPVMDDSAKAMDLILEAHLSEFDQFQAEVKGPVTIIAHSVGSWFALGLLAKRNHHIEKVKLVHPFLRRPGFMGHAILRVIGLVSRHDFLSQGLLFVRQFLKFPVSALREVTEEELLKCFQVARHEEAVIARDESRLTVTENHASKIEIFHRLGDWWCLPHSLAGLRESVQIRSCPEPHSFVIRPRHRFSLVKRLFPES